MSYEEEDTYTGGIDLIGLAPAYTHTHTIDDRMYTQAHDRNTRRQ